MTDPPTPEVARLLARLHAAGRYLDALALNVHDQATADLARAHATTCWDAALAYETARRQVDLVAADLRSLFTPGADR
jgi:hypothetical protein